jgi:hypothetical protein
MKDKTQRLYPQNDKVSGFVEVPLDWTAGDYSDYVRGYKAAQRAGHEEPMRRLLGVLYLGRKGNIDIQVEGVTVDAEKTDWGKLTAETMGFLINAVAVPLELTQLIPFGLSTPSGNGTTTESQ